MVFPFVPVTPIILIFFDGLSKKLASGSEDVKIDKSKSLPEKGDIRVAPNEKESKEIETLEKSEEIVEVEKTENIKE